MQDMSYEFPGHKDYVRVKQPGQKAVKMTKHILLLTLRECFAEFNKAYPEEKISFSTFTTLRSTTLSILTIMIPT